MIILNGKIENVETGDEQGDAIGIRSDRAGKTFDGDDTVSTTFFPFTLEMSKRIGWANKKANVRFFISDEPIDPSQVEKQFIQFLFGDVSVRRSHMYGSELTGYMGTDENFKVGGHDLVQILEANEGKFIHLEIQLFDKAPAERKTKRK